VSLLEVYELAAERGELDTEYLGLREVAGRRCLMLRRTLPAREDYPAKVTDVYIDTELLVPVCIEAIDWNDQFESRYVYTDIRINTGLTPADFTEEAAGF
jgi:outer membrane lipoprotein-sorting protein